MVEEVPPTKPIAGENGMSDKLISDIEAAMTLAEANMDGMPDEGWSPLSGMWMVEELRKGIESKEKELQSAKAENGRLVEAFKKWGLDDGHLIDCPHGDRLAGIPGEIIGGGCSENCQRVDEALSSSNALDYWRGEVRKARKEGFESCCLDEYIGDDCDACAEQGDSHCG